MTDAARPRTVLFTLWLVVFVGASQFLLVAPVLPRIAEELLVPDGRLGWLVSCYAVAVGACALVAGPISDRVGRRAVLVAGTALQAVALVAHALAVDFWSLLALRTLSGVASGVLSGASIAYVGDVVPYARRGQALGWVTSGMAFGQILGVPLGTLLADAAGFRAPFVVLGVVMAVAFVITAARLPAPDIDRNAAALTVRSALRDYVDLGRRPEIAAINAASVTLLLGVSLFIVYMPTWLEEDFHATSREVAALFLVGGLANAVAGPAAGALSDRIGRKGLIVGASTGLALLMALTAEMPSLWTVYALFFVIMAFAGMRMSPMQALLTALVRGGNRGALLSLNMAAGQVGFALGSAASGPLYHSAGFRGNSVASGAVALLTAAIVALYASEPAPETPLPVGEG